MAGQRAIGIGRTEGFTKLIFDEATHRIIGGGIVGVHAGDLISELALAIARANRRQLHALEGVGIEPGEIVALAPVGLC